MSFTNGFNNGFGLVNGVMQQNRNNERQAMLDERNEERYKQGLALQRERAEQAQSNADRSFGLQETQFKLGRQDVQWNQDTAMLDREDEADQREFDNNIKLKGAALQNQANLQSIKLNTLKIKREENKLLQEDTQRLAQKILSNTYTEKDKNEFIAKSGKYGEKLIQYADSHKAFVNEYQTAMNEFEKVMQNGGVVNGQPAGEAYLAKVNNLLQSDIGRTTMNSALYTSLSSRFKNNKNVNAVGFNRLVPMGVNDKGESIFAVHMDIQYKDGTIKQDVPATKGQSSNGDDAISLVTLNQIKGAVGEATTLSDRLSKDVQSNPALAQRFGADGKTQGEYKVSNGIMFNNKTGEYKQVRSNTSSMKPNQALSAARKMLESNVPGDFAVGDMMSPAELSPQDKIRYYELIKMSGLPLSEAEEQIRTGEYKSLLQTLQEQDAAN